MDQSEAPLVALTKFAIHLIARIEALETLLIQKDITTKPEIHQAIVKAERGFGLYVRTIRRPDEKDFEPGLADILERLKSRHRDRLR